MKQIRRRTGRLRKAEKCHPQNFDLRVPGTIAPLRRLSDCTAEATGDHHGPPSSAVLFRRLGSWVLEGPAISRDSDADRLPAQRAIRAADEFAPRPAYALDRTEQPGG